MASSLIASQAAKYTLGSTLDGLDEPLIGGNDEENQGEVEEGEDRFKKKGVSIMDGIVGSVLLAAAGTSAAAMAISASVVVYISGAVCCAITPLVGWQRTQIIDTRGIRDFINELRKDVGRFRVENDKFTANIDELEVQTDNLGGVESNFREIAEKNGQSVDELVGLVKENAKIMKAMKDLMKGDIAQLLIRTVMAGDVNEDFSMDPREVEFLILRLQQVEFIKFDEERFRNVIEQHEGSMDGIMNIVLKIFDDDLPDEDKIFVIDDTGNPADFQAKMENL